MMDLVFLLGVRLVLVWLEKVVKGCVFVVVFYIWEGVDGRWGKRLGRLVYLVGFV